MYTLRELEAKFLKCSVEKADKNHGRKLPDGSIQWGGFDIDVFTYVTDLAEADGISFLCPKCFEENGGRVGTHSVHIFFEGRKAPDRVCMGGQGHAVRWHASGTGLDDLSLTPSILLMSGCNWHGFVGSSGIKPGHAG